MQQPFDSANKLSKEFLDANLKSIAGVSKNLQTIAVEATEYGKKAFESSTVAMERLFEAKSLDKVFEVQADYARQAYEGLVAEATRMSALYAEAAKEAYRPFEGLVGKAR